MEFRAPTVASQQNAIAIDYLTKNLADPTVGKQEVQILIKNLGNAVQSFPDWHPILTVPNKHESKQSSILSKLETFNGIDHTSYFVRGFVTCPYSEKNANGLLDSVNKVQGLHAYRLNKALYMDNAYPVVVEATNVKMEADGTIVSQDAIRWFVQQAADEMRWASVAETWWNIRSLVLGRPHGSRSSLFVNSFAGSHMRKILEALNESGVFGPIKEESLDMLSQQKRASICELFIQTAVSAWDQKSSSFEFELRGERCIAAISDTWEDGEELSISVRIGEFDLVVTGFYYPKNNKITSLHPTGKLKLAKKFL